MLPTTTRRGFLYLSTTVMGALAAANVDVLARQPAQRWVRPGGRVPPGEWWAGGGPRLAAAASTIVQPDEAGERLVLSGAVYGSDGRTPLPGVTVYVYQTDVRGRYNPEGKFGVPHRIRGWVNTDADGRYRFETVKPGPYPNRTTPAHIHMTVCRDDMPEWWLPEIRFEGDSRLTTVELAESSADGRFGNVRPLVTRGGILHCTRDLRL